MTQLDPRPARPPVPEPPGHREQGTHPARLAVLAGLVALAGLAGGWSLLAMILAIVVMIFLHELGHYLTARWAGMKVTEFFIGFGPRIWSFRRGETEYGLKAIPAGAYVKIVGMHNLDEYDPADADRTYMSKPFWRRLSVAVAGSTMHFLLALACLFTLFAAVGVPGGTIPTTEEELEQLEDSAAWTVAYVGEDTPAGRAGVRPGDEVVAIDGEPVGGWRSFSVLVRERPGERVEVVLRRDGEEVTTEVALANRHPDTGERVGFFGVSPSLELPVQRLGAAESVGESFSTFGRTVVATFEGLGRILSPSGLADLGARVFAPEEDRGPAVGDGRGGGGGVSSDDANRPISIVGITRVGADLIQDDGLAGFLGLFVVLNVFIGVFNLVPLLPLDGGHVAIAVYEKVRSMLQGGRPYHVDVAKLLPVTYAVVLVLIFIGVSTIYLDIADPIGG